MGTLYDNIMKLCNERGIKGGKMCTDIGISNGLLTDLKMGRRTGVSAVTAQKIADYFGVSVIISNYFKIRYAIKRNGIVKGAPA